MQGILRHNILAFVALTLWLLASWSGAHGHLCFDGQEPPLSVHMDILGDHSHQLFEEEHHADKQHVDADMDLGQLTFAKLVKFDAPVLLTALFFFVVIFKRPAVFASHFSSGFTRRLHGLRPPLRAPPSAPAYSVQQP